MPIAPPNIADEEIEAGWRAVHGTVGPAPRVLRRRPFRQSTGLSGSHFEHVRIACGAARVDGLLKLGRLAGGLPTREWLFFAELAARVPVRVPRCLAVGPRPSGADGWVLMERLRGVKPVADWRPEDTLTALRLLARLHAAFLGEAPGVLPRPFTRDLESTLGVVPAGVQALRARYAELPHLPRIAGERALALLLELARCPDALRGPLARSPETLLHGDYHRANLAARDGEEPVIFDWQFVGAGPPACDLAVFWLYLGAVNRRGLFGLDRAAVRARSLTWAQVLDVYGGALRALRPDADIDAIASCADAAIVCETVRGIGYLGPAMEPFIGLLRFAYRDHPMLARPLVRYLGLDQGLRLGAEIFADFEGRAARLLDGRRSSG